MHNPVSGQVGENREDDSDRGKNLRQGQRERQWQREEDLLLALEQDGCESQFLEHLEFASGDASLSLWSEEHESHDDGGDDAQDGVDPHLLQVVSHLESLYHLLQKLTLSWFGVRAGLEWR